MRLSKAMAAKVIKMAGGDQSKPKPVKLCAPKPKPVRWSLTVSVPVNVVSESNRRDHWAVKLRRKNEQINAVAYALGCTPVRLCFCYPPVVVTFVRIGRMGPHQEQDDDNIRGAFKAIRDYIAGLIGVDDGSPLVTWRYEQRAGEPGVELRFESHQFKEGTR